MSLAESLRDELLLSELQIESLLSYQKVAKGELKLREAVQERADKRVSIGSYYHTVRQARKKVRRSLATVLVAMQLGLVRSEDVRKLVELVGGNPRNLSQEDVDRFGRVLKALLDRIVM